MPSKKEHFNEARLKEIRNRAKLGMYAPQAQKDIALLIATIKFQRKQMSYLIRDFIRIRMMLEDLPPPPWEIKDELEDRNRDS